MWRLMTCFAIVASRFSSWTSLTMKIMSKRDKMVGMKSMFSSALVSSQRPKTLLAAASTEHLELRVVVIPALAMEMVCCSMASWMATLSSSRILSNSSMQTTPPSANTMAPPSITKLRVDGSLMTDAVSPAALLPFPDV
uniref:Putative secreted protein n=1 Tax=Ixodes ricinus TaxID=34613 RepID=A0A6B0UTH6_IXORI